METFFSYVNLIASGTFVVLAIKYRCLTFDQSVLERVCWNLMVVFCASICVKAMYMASVDAFRSDPFGILFRCAYLGMYIGQIRSTYRHGVSVALKRPQTDIMAVSPR